MDYRIDVLKKVIKKLEELKEHPDTGDNTVEIADMVINSLMHIIYDENDNPKEITIVIKDDTKKPSQNSHARRRAKVMKAP